MTTSIRSTRFATGAQIRAGRALLGWTRSDLAAAARLHPNAVKYWERHDRLPRKDEVGCKRIRDALFAAGVIAVAAPAPGVCLLPECAQPVVEPSPAPPAVTTTTTDTPSVSGIVAGDPPGLDALSIRDNGAEVRNEQPIHSFNCGITAAGPCSRSVVT